MPLTPCDSGKIMFKENAPEECVKAGVKDPKECGKIMFRLNAPEECVEAGAKDPKECGKIMFRLNAPQECLDAGITGENRNDPKDCEKIMNKMRESEFSDGQRGGFGPPGAGCSQVQNSEDRLKCYDSAVSGFSDFEQRHTEDFEDRFRETQEMQKQCADQCSRNNQAWSFRDGICECFGGNFNEQQNYQQRKIFSGEKSR